MTGVLDGFVVLGSSESGSGSESRVGFIVSVLVFVFSVAAHGGVGLRFPTSSNMRRPRSAMSSGEMPSSAARAWMASVSPVSISAGTPDPIQGRKRRKKPCKPCSSWASPALLWLSSGDWGLGVPSSGGVSNLPAASNGDS